MQKLLIILPKNVENLSKNLNVNFQKWFPKYNLKNPKYIKNIQVCSLRTPGLHFDQYYIVNKAFEGCVELQANLNSEHLSSIRGGIGLALVRI